MFSNYSVRIHAPYFNVKSIDNNENIHLSAVHSKAVSLYSVIEYLILMYKLDHIKYSFKDIKNLTSDCIMLMCYTL